MPDYQLWTIVSSIVGGAIIIAISISSTISEHKWHVGFRLDGITDQLEHIRGALWKQVMQYNQTRDVELHYVYALRESFAKKFDGEGMMLCEALEKQLTQKGKGKKNAPSA